MLKRTRPVVIAVNILAHVKQTSLPLNCILIVTPYQISMARMDAACGAQQSLRAVRMREGGAVTAAQTRVWNSWKSRSPPEMSPPTDGEIAARSFANMKQ